MAAERTGDRAKLDEYLGSVREIERRIQNAEAQNSRELPIVESPAGIPTLYEEHAFNVYHATLFAYFLEKLQSTADGDRALLDNVMILYGGAISDGNRHDIKNLPILMAVAGGGQLKGGRHIKYQKDTARLTNLQLTLLNKLGVNTEHFGDSTGRLEDLSELSSPVV